MPRHHWKFLSVSLSLSQVTPKGNILNVMQREKMGEEEIEQVELSG